MRKLRPRNTIAIHISEGFGIWAIVPVYVFGKAKPSGLLFLGNRIDNDFAKRIGTSSIWTEQTTVLILTFQYASLTNSFAS
jgi:hypothetical protein